MKISIITVCYNSAATIGFTLESVAAQTYKNVEHIVIDGGSKDDTLGVIARQGKHVARVVSEPDKGIYDAMNKGLALATGEVIGFINADDFYASPTVLEKIAHAFETTSTDSCYGDLCYVGQEDTTQIVRYWKSSEFRPRAFEAGWCPPHPTFFVKKSVYERFGGFNLEYAVAADVELMARFLEVKKISYRYIPEVLVKMRMGGVSNRSVRGVLRQNVEVKKALLSLGLRFSYLKFFLNKLISRSLQFIRRPQSAK
ncbi:glycosyltransferase family 2 protein [Variovorax sp. LT1R16]|uniref:glycosyltransferase family 2 protein n=1 Tax=Variovorax sp. LT1R16 TaxID=3443728 RepID=UPI003F453C08